MKKNQRRYKISNFQSVIGFHRKLMFLVVFLSPSLKWVRNQISAGLHWKAYHEWFHILHGPRHIRPPEGSDLNFKGGWTGNRRSMLSAEVCQVRPSWYSQSSANDRLMPEYRTVKQWDTKLLYPQWKAGEAVLAVCVYFYEWNATVKVGREVQCDYCSEHERAARPQRGLVAIRELRHTLHLQAFVALTRKEMLLSGDCIKSHQIEWRYDFTETWKLMFLNSINHKEY